MHRFTAKCKIRLPFHLLIKCTKEAELRYKGQIEDFDVELSLKPTGEEFRVVQGEYLTCGISRVQVDVARNEHMELGEDEMPRSFYEDLKLKYRNVAVVALNRIIRVFKYRLKNPLLYELSPIKNSLQGNEFEDFDWTDENGHRVGGRNIYDVSDIPPGLGILGETSGFGVKVFTPIEEPLIKCALQTGVEAELWEELLSDAQAAIFQGNLRRAVLEMAIASEVAVKQTFWGRSTTAEVAYEYLEDKGRINTRVTELIDSIAKQAFGESFRDISKTAYENIDFLFRCRNKIAHRGEITFRNDAGILNTVNSEMLQGWWKSIETLFEWLSSHR